MKHAKFTAALGFKKLEELGKAQRKAQVELSELVAGALRADLPLVAEAPTGTGKTLAYLLGGLEAQQTTKKALVVATATVALQEQIIKTDVPLLALAGLLNPADVVIAKGRGRYFCPAAAAKLVAKSKVESVQVDMFDSAKTEENTTLFEANHLLSQFANGWNGELDNLDEKPKVWPIVSASADGCKKTRCESYDACPFYKARLRLSKAKIVVANQDLVLADLQQQAQEKETVLQQKAGYMLVVDEAHHLPAKAISSGRAQVSFSKMGAAASGLGFVLSSMAKLGKFSKIVKNGLNTRAFCDVAKQLQEELAGKDYDSAGNCRVKVWNAKTSLFLENAVGLYDAAKKLGDKLNKSSSLSEKEKGLLADYAVALSKLADQVAQAKRFLGYKEGAVARWLSVSEGYVAINETEIDSGAVLKKLLQTNAQVSAVYVSATVKGVGRFQPFLSEIGLTEGTATKVLPYVLPYENSKLVLPKMKHNPKEGGYSAELLEKLPSFIKEGEANLVLFNSIEQLRTTVASLKSRYGEAVLSQLECSMSDLLDTHKDRVAAGQTSILCGLEKMGEGLDLAGKLLTNVIITRLPFDTPADPVEQAKKELIESRGGNYFNDYALPRATTKLVQKCGRLVRTVEDTGTIVIFDNRLTTTNYGKKMLEALPPFQLVKM